MEEGAPLRPKDQPQSGADAQTEARTPGSDGSQSQVSPAEATLALPGSPAADDVCWLQKTSWKVAPLRENVQWIRDRVALVLHAWRVDLPAGLLADVRLVVSELFTNALLYDTSGQTSLTVGFAVSATKVRVEVSDGTPGEPTRGATADLMSPGGRGLMLVDALAASHGWEPAGDGKRAWAQFDRRPGHHAAAPGARAGTVAGTTVGGHGTAAEDDPLSAAFRRGAALVLAGA